MLFKDVPIGQTFQCSTPGVRHHGTLRKITGAREENVRAFSLETGQKVYVSDTTECFPVVVTVRHQI